MTTTTFMELLGKYKLGQINQEELQRLKAAVAAGTHQSLIEDDILESLRGTVQTSAWAPAEADAVLQQILQTSSSTNKHYRTWYLAAAALVGAALLLGGLYRARHQAPVAVVTPARSKVIVPGSDKAMLTLADGSTIPLDSAHTGSLAQQGNTHIINNGKGLAYNGNASNDVVLYNIVSTPRGGQYELTLADGSKVWLNAASSIRFPTSFNGTERRVEITGEAYFQVAANAKMPFHVAVTGRPDVSVNVLGTSFNVMAYPDEKAITTTLETGAIQMIHGSETQVLQPGFGASISGKDAALVLAKADLEQTLAWKEGKFRFHNTNIQTIMRQLARWYDIDVEYQGDISGVALTGLISRRENAATLLKILEATHSVRFEMQDNKITVMPFDPR